MTSKEESLGVKASKIAQGVASKWLDDAWQIIQKKVLDTANRGLFHAQLRFTDIVPQDPQNQQRLLKILEREQLSGRFDVFEGNDEKDEESGVTLSITWGPV
eukprot:TRINITY_DN3467_c0_g1_i1.p1 TRINITY_DN3467_c0_g1~~TRINITY_DN3467_c0_g1_i1.p1  ORF type:complete len:118 (-),score=37.73 TRINITY_DN3467_c0_g1_i1:54-359(-)